MLIKLYPQRAYAAIAYTRGDHDQRAKIADLFSAYLIEVYNVSVFSPISQSHRIGRYVMDGSLCHEVWLGQDSRWMEVSDVCYVYADELWQNSFGVAWEIGWFNAKGIPVRYIDPEDVILWSIENGIEL